MPADVIGFGYDGVWVALSNGDGTFQPMQRVIDNFGYGAGGWRVDMHPRVLADVTGDGRADIVGFGDAGVYVALSNGDGTFTEVGRVIDNFGYGAGGWRVDMHPRVLADVTGNGRADIVGFGGAGVYVALSNGDGTFTEVGRVIDDFAYNGGWRVDRSRRMQPGGYAVDRHPRVLADITGERGADIVGFGQDAVWVALSNGDGTFQRAIPTSFNFGADQSAGGWEGFPRLLADVTGDGRADIVAISPYEMHVLLSIGNGGFQDRYYVNATLAAYWEEDPVVLADITGDGRPDIVMIDYLGVASSLNNGDGSFQPERRGRRDFASRHYWPETQRFLGDWRWGWHPRYVADITGDGRADIVGFGNDGVWVALSNGDGTFQPAYRAIDNFGVDHSAGGWSADRYPRTVADLTGRRIVRRAQFVSQSVPEYMKPGEARDVAVTMRNTGNDTWTQQKAYRLGSQSPQDNLTWGTGRVDVASAVAPQQSATLMFRVTAPPGQGLRTFQWRMLQEGVEWFGELTPPVQISVAEEGPTTVPDVVGMSRRDALDAIRAADLVANIAPSGSGRHEIISQAPTAGQVVGRWTTVDLVAEKVS